MNETLKVIGYIAAGWLTASVLLAIAWALGARKILRKPPQPPVITMEPRTESEKAFVTDLKRRNRTNGRDY